MRLIEKFRYYLEQDNNRKLDDFKKMCRLAREVAFIQAQLTESVNKTVPLIEQYRKQLATIRNHYQDFADWDIKERLSLDRQWWLNMMTQGGSSLVEAEVQSDLSSFSSQRMGEHNQLNMVDDEKLISEHNKILQQIKHDVVELFEKATNPDNTPKDMGCYRFIEMCLQLIENIKQQMQRWGELCHSTRVAQQEKNNIEEDESYHEWCQTQQQIYNKLLNESLIVLCAQGDLDTIKDKWHELQEELNLCYGWTEYDEQGNDIGSEKIYPLHVACQERQLEVARFLIKMGANPALEDSQQFWDPETHQYRGHRAYDYLTDETDKTLYSNYLLKQRRLSDLEQNSLIVLCNYGDLKAIQKNWRHLKKELNQTQYGYYPLHVACEERHMELIKFLLKQGANPELRDGNNCQANDYLDVANGQYIEKVNAVQQTSNSWCAKLFCCFSNQPVQASNRPSASAERRRTIDSDSSLPIHYESSEAGSSHGGSPQVDRSGSPRWSWPAPDSYEQANDEDQQLTANGNNDPDPRPVVSEANTRPQDEEPLNRQQFVPNDFWRLYGSVQLDAGNGVRVSYTENGPITF